MNTFSPSITAVSHTAFLYCISHDYFFGEDHLWLQKVRGTKPRVLNKMLRSHIDFFPKYYKGKGNNAMVRCVRAAAKRIEDNKGISAEMQETYKKRKSAWDALQQVTQMDDTELSIPSDHLNVCVAETHAQLLKDLAEDEGQDAEAAAAYLKHIGASDKDTEGPVDADVVMPTLARGETYAREMAEVKEFEERFETDDDGSLTLNV